MNWWREEFPTEQEFAHGLATLKKNNLSVDLVLTHDAPETYRNELNTDVPHSALNDYFEQLRESILLTSTGSSVTIIAI